jgi:hypothetical protein
VETNAVGFESPLPLCSMPDCDDRDPLAAHSIHDDVWSSADEQFAGSAFSAGPAEIRMIPERLDDGNNARGQTLRCSRLVIRSMDIHYASFCQGSTHGFQILFQRNRDWVHSFLSRLVGARNADDLTQLTFLSVIRAKGRFRNYARFRPWIYAIAINAARDYLKSSSAASHCVEREL